MFFKLLTFLCICSFAMSISILEITGKWAKEANREVVNDVHMAQHDVQKEYRVATNDVEKEYHVLTNEVKTEYHVIKNDITTGYQVVEAEEKEAMDDYNTIVRILRKPRTPEKYLTGFRLGSSNSFDWTSCGSPDDLVTIDKMTLQPDTLVFPENVTFSAQGKINSDMKAPIPLDFELQKKILGTWITVPCEMIGGCHYDDICVMLATMCPSPMPCKCPFKAGPIDVAPTTMNVPVDVPSGDYKIHINAMNSSKEVFCLDITLAVG